MTIKQNSAGGKTLSMGAFSIWTDPCDKVWNPSIINDKYRLCIFIGWLNFGYAKRNKKEQFS